MQRWLIVAALLLLAMASCSLATAEEAKAEPAAEPAGEPAAEAVEATPKAEAKAPEEVEKAPAEAEKAPAAEPAKPAEPTAADLLKLSDKQWRTRHIKGNDRKSVQSAEDALKLGADEFEAIWRVSRACFWVAENDADKKVKIIFGEKGWKAGKRAAELKPERVEGWYWGVVSLGQYSTGIGIAKAFFEGISSKFESMNKKAITIDARYGYAGPNRSYGRYWFMVPWPKRNYDRAEKMMKQSITDYPPKLRSYFYLAEIYLAKKQRDDAKQALETCIGLDPKKEEYPDGVIYLKECQKLYNKEFK